MHPAGAMAQLHVASRDWMGCNECSNQLWDSERDLSSSADRKDKRTEHDMQYAPCFTILSSGLILAFVRYPDQIGKTKKGSYPFGVEEPNLRWSTIAFRNVHDHMMH